MTRRRIQDKDVCSALEVLETEFENQEELISELKKELDDLSDENRRLKDQVEEYETLEEELQETIKSLENAVAEAYLTSNKDERTKSDNEQNNRFLSRRSVDVPDSTGDKETN